MSYSLSIKDNATPHLRSVMAALSPRALNPLLGRAAVNSFKRNFFALDRSHRNKLGGTPTHFYSQCARSTHFQVLADGVKIAVSQVGARQRLEGGDIRPVKSKWLTIPAIAASYGRRAREFDNLRFIQFRPDLAALVAGEGGATVERKVKGSTIKRPVKGTTKGQVLFWLKKGVVQSPDNTVIPSQDALVADLNEAASSYLQLLSRRAA